MSDTPRTDRETMQDGYGPEVVHADLARQLERELAEARKDTERLDWLENSSLEIYNPETDSVSCYDLRQAIDNEMKGADA